MIKSGVYSIRNTVNGKTYVGGSKGIRGRWSYHRIRLRRGTHDNSYLQNAWNKYGEDNFEFSVLEHVLDCSLLEEREQYWIDKINSVKRSVGYNLRPIASTNKGVKWPDEARKKKSVSSMGEGNSFYGKNHTDAAKKLISQANKGRLKGVPKSTEHRRKIGESQKGKICPHSKANAMKRAKPVLQCNHDGVVVKEWESIRAAARAFEISKTAIYLVLKGINPTARGFTWRLAK